MKNSYQNQDRATRRGFTLLELLVVIAIITILAGIMFPATNSALKRAATAHAENTAHQLKTSISTYFTEYRKYPVSPGTEESYIFRTNHELMDVLLGSDKEAQPGGLNPRGIVFYSGKQAKPLGGGRYSKGVTLQADGSGELWDPFGEYFYVMMDLDYNNRVTKPTWDTSTESAVIPESILVWSSGPSKEENDTEDNIKTW